MTQVSFRVDDTVKKNAEQVCAEIGISMSAALNIYLTKIGRERRIPFELTADYDPFYSSENMSTLRRRAVDAAAGKNMHEHDLIEVD